MAGRTGETTTIRPGRVDDVPRLTAIYNHYVVHTAVTFDIEPWTVADRAAWFEQFGASGCHRLVVAEGEAGVVGYACSHPFRPKRAYDTSVETSIYCAPEATGQGFGSLLYAALFKALAEEDVRTAVAGITLPNPASIALHERFGFEPVGVMHQIGRKLGDYWDVAWYEKRLG